MTDAKSTPLTETHRAAGARMVEFAGWTMPVQYRGVMEEHRAVRNAAGLFDVSHMGEISVRGPGSEAFLQRLTPNDVSKLVPGRAHYSGLLTERGTYLDDLLVYRLEEEDFLLVVNAANAESDYAWIAGQPHAGIEISNVSDEYALLALQGPRAHAILERLTQVDLSDLRYYRFIRGKVGGIDALISRTGYTGEDGFELYLPPDEAPRLWKVLLAEGKKEGLEPAGLGARDTLRLEAAMALYGHEIDETTTPYEAGLSWVVKLEAGDFLGRSALVAQKESGVARLLVGFEVSGRGIARQGHEVCHGDEVVGAVTSGTFSPTLQKAIGMAYVPSGLADPGTELAVSVRRRRLPIRLVEIPFYRRPR